MQCHFMVLIWWWVENASQKIRSSEVESLNWFRTENELMWWKVTIDALENVAEFYSVFNVAEKRNDRVPG